MEKKTFPEDERKQKLAALKEREYTINTQLKANEQQKDEYKNILRQIDTCENDFQMEERKLLLIFQDVEESWKHNDDIGRITVDCQETLEYMNRKRDTAHEDNREEVRKLSKKLDEKEEEFRQELKKIQEEK